MKYNPSIAFDEMSGSAKGVTAAKTRGRKYIRNRGYGGQIMTAVPNLSGVEAPAAATIVLTPAAMTFTLASIPADVTNLKLVIQASDPQGNGITRAYSKVAAFDAPLTPVTTAIDIKAKYDAKCGAPSAGSPKVFFKYFFVNTATGEKSGTMLAEYKWAAADAGGEP